MEAGQGHGCIGQERDEGGVRREGASTAIPNYRPIMRD